MVLVDSSLACNHGLDLCGNNYGDACSCDDDYINAVNSSGST